MKIRSLADELMKHMSTSTTQVTRFNTFRKRHELCRLLGCLSQIKDMRDRERKLEGRRPLHAMIMEVIDNFS